MTCHLAWADLGMFAWFVPAREEWFMLLYTIPPTEDDTPQTGRGVRVLCM
jgi:hypothetical protein